VNFIERTKIKEKRGQDWPIFKKKKTAASWKKYTKIELDPFFQREPKSFQPSYYFRGVI